MTKALADYKNFEAAKEKILSETKAEILQIKEAAERVIMKNHEFDRQHKYFLNDRSLLDTFDFLCYTTSACKKLLDRIKRREKDAKKA